MCELCNGTHVIHIQTSYSIKFETCPVCGPMDESLYQMRIDLLKKRIAEAKAKYSMKGA